MGLALKWREAERKIKELKNGDKLKSIKRKLDRGKGRGGQSKKIKVS